MAKRYSGDLVVDITYVDGDRYEGYVKGPGGIYRFDDLHAPQIPLARSGLLDGYDSPRAYDEMAQSAIGFATYDREDLGYPDYDEDGQDYLIRRSRNGRARSRRHPKARY